MYEIRAFLLILLGLLFMKVNCKTKDSTKSKKFVPYFKPGNNIEEPIYIDTTEKYEPSVELVSLLVKNVKEIFGDLLEKPEISDTEAVNVSSVLQNFTDTLQFKDLTLNTLVDKTQENGEPNGINNTLHELLSNDVKFNHTKLFVERKVRNATSELDMNLKNTNITDNNYSPEMEEQQQSFLKRSCIMCNNVALEDCNEPKNKLIQSTMCERENDMCYTMHTPFGILDRGCFNPEFNLTTYVCSCNLCNFIPISDMPLMTRSQKEWASNVIEISRSMGLRKSIFSDMSCLRCEVNQTLLGTTEDDGNCLDGNLGRLPVQLCEQNEVCAVKAITAEGYVWRGCLKAPLYNYWWNLCDTDLCNYDTGISLYDFF